MATAQNSPGMHDCVRWSMKPGLDLRLYGWALWVDDDRCWLSCGPSADLRLGADWEGMTRGPT
jgi:hypothetical protein